MTDAEIDALSDSDQWSTIFDDKTRAALELADALCTASSHELDPVLIGELQFHFTERELAELILVCGQANLNNRAGNAAKQLLGEQS